MKAITERERQDPVRRSGQQASWWRRLAWFVALWVAGVAAVGVVAMALRWLLPPAGH